MNKKLPLSLIFLILIAAAEAQVRLAAYIGLHSASVNQTSNLPGWDTAYKPYFSSRTGVSLGIISDIPIGKSHFYFQPGLNYSSKGRQFYKNYDTANAATDTLSLKTVLKMGYIEIPLNFTYKIFLNDGHTSSFFLSAGPYFAFIYSASMSYQSVISGSNSMVDYETGTNSLLIGNAVNKYQTFDIGINARAGFELGKVILSCYGSKGLTSFYQSPDGGSFHHQVIGASLGIWLASSSPASPTKAKAKTVKVKDSDHDGIPDDQDLCPHVRGVARYHGCPVPDTDKDGIDDEHDSCKTVPGLAKYHGCPVPDTDGDGIDDEHDSCKTVPGVKENNGCPEIKKEIKEKVNYVAHNILFATASDQLTPDSYLGLNDLVSLLNQHPELKLTIEGHTDTVGTPERNLILSQKRAQVVKDYLASKGITENRLIAIGYGQEKPIADNSTELGRAANRRVELKLTSQSQ